ncbi:MAG: zinc-binding dehydrogenase [Myxococcota bacterium]
MAEMWALTYDRSREDWMSSRGMVKERVPVPTLDEANPDDRRSVIIKVRYAGFCGTDRGIWWRKAFDDIIHGSLDDEGRDKRIFGHELLGEIVAVGSEVMPVFGYNVGDVVTTESHVVCNNCPQCDLGQHHVCQNDTIIGLSRDGCFAEFAKLPAKALWPTDLNKIRPEVAAVQEPFGNAMHACQTVDLREKTVAILGTGTIGLFALLIAKGMGAKQVIGVEVDPKKVDLAYKLGADHVLTPGRPPADAPWRSDPELAAKVLELTHGTGVDVAMEMAGVHSSTNNAIRITRRGGDVVLFGVRNGHAVFEDAHRIVMNGLSLHGVVGRRIFGTWQRTKSLLEDHTNGIQDAIWNTILMQGKGTIVPLSALDPTSFEAAMAEHPKLLLQMS